MNEVIMSPNLLNNESYNKVFRRVVKIRRSSELFENYVASSQLEYSKFATKTREDCELFEDGLIKNGCMSSRRCQEILQFVKLFKEVAISIQKMTAFNMIGFKGIQNDQPAKLQELFRRRLANFLEYLSQYNEHSKNLDKLFSSYLRKGQEFKDALGKCREFSKPTNFYNPDASESFQREVDEKFSSAVAKETAVTKQMQQMLIRKRQLQTYVKEMKDCMVMMVKYHIGKISEMVRIVLDSIAWEKAGETIGVCGGGAGPEEACQMEMNRLNLIYNSTQQLPDQFNQQPSFLSRTFTLNQIPADYRFFMQRCENYIKMRRTQLAQSCFARKRLRVFLESLLQSMKSLRQGFELIKRQCCGTTGQYQDYKIKLAKYFGNTLSQAFYLVEHLVNAPSGIMSRLQQFIQTHLQRIFQLINAQEMNCLTYDQNIGPIFRQYLALKQHIDSQQVISSQDFVQLSSNVRATFLHLKAILNNINNQQDTVNKMLLDEIHGIMTMVNRECFMHLNQLRLQKEKGNYEVFRKINVDSEVLGIMNEDERYQIMFNNFYTGDIAAIHFRSYIDHGSYQNAKNLLEKKKVVSMNDRNRPFLNSCCVGSGAMRNYPGSSMYKCKLYNQKLIKGKLITLPEGIHWVSKPILLFGNKSKLVIPKSDIRGFEMKDPDPLLINAIVVKTQMGDIIFSGFQKKDEVFEHLSRVFRGQDQHMAKEVGHQTDSRLSSRGMSELKITDRSTIMNTSKIIRRNHTTSSMSELPQALRMSELPQTLQLSNQMVSSVPGPVRTVSQRDCETDFSNLVQKWNSSHNFFQAEFVMTEIRRDQNTIRSLYEARFYGIRTIMKELKSLCFSPSMLEFDFKWKLSFPSNRNLKSFTISQYIKVQPVDDNMRIQILTRKPSSYSSYLQDIFYESLKKMDQNLTQFIAKTLDKECEVQQKQQTLDTLTPIPTSGRQRQASINSQIRRDVANLSQRPMHLLRQDSLVLGTQNQLASSVPPLTSPQNHRTDSNPLVNTVSSQPVLNSAQLLQAQPSPPTNNSVQGRPEQVRMILGAFFVLFLALFLM